MRREIAIDPLADDDGSDDHVDTEFDDDARNRIVQVATGPRAMTPIEALMQCPPGHEPDTSQTELYHLREIIEDALQEVLDDRERWIFNAVVVERLSYRQLAQQLQLAKSYVHRIQQKSCQKLADHLRWNDHIVEHLCRSQTKSGVGITATTTDATSTSGKTSTASGSRQHGTSLGRGGATTCVATTASTSRGMKHCSQRRAAPAPSVTRQAPTRRGGHCTSTTITKVAT